jgi:hypothetical protein
MENYYHLFKESRTKIDKGDITLLEEEEISMNLENISIGSFTNNNEKYEDNIYYDKNKFDFKEVENVINSHNANTLNSNKELLEHFAELEKICLFKIKFTKNKISKFYHKILKDMAFNLLENKIRENLNFKEMYKDIKIILIKFFEKFQKQDNLIQLEGEEQILNILNKTEHFEKPSTISVSNLTNLKKFEKGDGEKAKEILSIFKNIYRKNIDNLLTELNLFFNTQNFPYFLVRAAKFKIKRRIIKKYLPKFKEIFLRNNFLNSFEYLLIVDKIKEIAQKKLEIFDERVLNLEIREILFKIILLISRDIFNPVEDDPYFQKLFGEILQKCVFALSVNLKFEGVKSDNESINSNNFDKISFTQNEKNSQKKSFPKPFSDCMLLDTIEQDSLCDLFKQLQLCLKNEIENYLFIILSLSLLFNNYDLTQKTIINTSAREKECLRKILLNFNEFYPLENLDVWKFNQILESVIFSLFFKNTYSDNLILKKINRKKLSKLLDEESLSSSDDSNQVINYFKQKLSFNFIDNILKNNFQFLSNRILLEYNLLLENIPQKKQISCCKNILKFFRDFFFPYKEKEVFMNIQTAALVPYDKYNYSNHVCIIIPGFISQYHNNHTQWENFIVDFDIYVDFYFYIWESRSGMKVINDIMKFLGGLSLTLLTRNFLKVFAAYRTYQHKNNLFANTTKRAKYFGKFLAYILASKLFYEKRTITLVGFSLGGHVSKHCIKELIMISEYLPEVKDLIQNIIFIGAAVAIPSHKELWKNVRKIVSGRIINCYSPNDEVLLGIFKYITKKDSIGTCPLKIDTLEDLIENYDLSDLNIQHQEYKCYLNDIIKKVKLF